VAPSGESPRIFAAHFLDFPDSTTSDNAQFPTAINLASAAHGRQIIRCKIAKGYDYSLRAAKLYTHKEKTPIKSILKFKRP